MQTHQQRQLYNISNHNTGGAADQQLAQNYHAAPDQALQQEFGGSHQPSGHEQNDRYMATQLSRSNTVDGQAQPFDLDGSSVPGGGVAANQAWPPVANAGQYSSTSAANQPGRQARTALFVGHLSPINGNAKSSSVHGNGSKKGLNSNVNARAAGSSRNPGQPGNPSIESAKKSTTRKSQGRDRVEVRQRAPSSGALPESASPHLKREPSHGKPTAAQEPISQQLGQLPGGAGSRNNQLLHGRHVSHAQTLNQQQNSLMGNFEPLGLQGQVANRSRLNNLPGQGGNLVGNHQSSQNFPAVMRANQLLEQKRHTTAGPSADAGSQNRLASSKPFQTRTSKKGSTVAESASSQAQPGQSGPSANRKLSGDSTRLRGGRFRNIYNPPQPDAFDYGPGASQGAAGALALGQPIEPSGGPLFQHVSGQQTGDASANRANSRQKQSQNLTGKGFMMKNGKNPIMMSGNKPPSHQAQQSRLYNQPSLEQHKQQSSTGGPRDPQYAEASQLSLTIETSLQTGAISLPNNNLRASRQRNHALMKPQAATELLPNQQSSFNAQQLRSQIGQKWNNISNKNHQRGPIMPIELQGGSQVQGPMAATGNYNSAQQPSATLPKRHHESASHRDVSARSQKSGISDVVSNRSRRAQQLAQHNMDSAQAQPSDQGLNQRPARNGALNAHPNAEQMNVAPSTGKFSGKELKRFGSPLTKASMPQRTSLQNVESQQKAGNAARTQQRQASSKFTQLVPQRFQGMLGQQDVSQGKDLDTKAGRPVSNYQSDGTLRTEQKRKNSQPAVGQGNSLRPGSSSIQKMTTGAQILKHQGYDSQIGSTAVQSQNPVRQSLQSRQSRNKNNQPRTRTEADQNKLKQFVESGSLSQPQNPQTNNAMKQEYQRPQDSQGFVKKQPTNQKLGYLQQQDQLKQQAMMASAKIGKLADPQFTGNSQVGQNLRKPFAQKRNNSHDQPSQQKSSEQRNRAHKKGMSAQLGAEMDGNLDFNQHAAKQQSNAYAAADAHPSPGPKFVAQQSQHMKNHMNKESIFSPKNTGGDYQQNPASFDEGQNQSKFTQNNKGLQKSRNPHLGLGSSIDKAAFLSNKEQMANLQGYVDQQYIKQPTTSTVNSTINTSREEANTPDAEATYEPSQKEQDSQGAGTGETVQPPSASGSKLTKERTDDGAGSDTKRSEQQMKETIQNQRSLPDKNGNFCKVILEVEREGQQQYINFKNGHNPILNIIEAQLKGLIQGSTFLGGLGSGNENDQNISYNPLKDFEEAKFASKSHGLITSYSANTHQGIQRNYNEDRVSIILNMTRPPNKDAASWPKCSFFAIYDGHGGSSCADFLKDHLHQIIIGQHCFPKDPRKALTDGCRIAEEKFLKLAMKDPEIDKSGSCAIIVLTVETECYVANVGDSRAIMSAENGLRVYELSQDHRPNEEDEFYRIQDHGGQVYQTQTYQTIPITNQFGQVTGQSRQMLYGPYRVLPGRLSVSRTFGDIEAKDESLGGKKGVVIAEPEISQFSIDDDKHDFIVLGCDGIFDRLTSVNCLDSAWSAMSQAIKSQKENTKKPPLTIHQITGKMADAILRSSAIEKSYDNLTIVIVAFKSLGNFYAKAKQQTRKQYLNISVQNESHS